MPTILLCWLAGNCVFALADPIKPANRVTIREAVQKFTTQVELTKDPLTYKVYEQNLREYLEWTKLTYVDQIDKDYLFEYRRHLMDGGNESLTADWKLLRISLCSWSFNVLISSNAFLSASSARLRSSISILDPYHIKIVPWSFRSGTF